MRLEVDMSGCDVLKTGSIIAIADGKGLIRGFQIDEKIINELLSNWKIGRYFCKYSKRNLGFFKAMIYSSVVCCLIENIDKPKEIELEICRDLRYHENDIQQRLHKLLRKKVGIKVNSITFKNLRGSDVDNYAYLMFKDIYNLLPTYINPSLLDIEKFLI